MDNNLVIVIIVIIAVLIIGALIVIPIGTNSGVQENNIENLAEEKILENNVSKKIIVDSKEESSAEDNENDNILEERCINTSPYHMNRIAGEVANIYNNAIDQMLKTDNISCHAISENNEEWAVSKLDLVNKLSYTKFNAGDEINSEYYLIYKNKTFYRFSRNLDSEDWVQFVQNNIDDYSGMKTIINGFFIYSNFNQSIDHSLYDYSLGEDTYIDNYECYKIIAVAKQGEYKFSKDIFISKEFNVIIGIDMHFEKDNLYLRYGYNSETINIPEYINNIIQ